MNHSVRSRLPWLFLRYGLKWCSNLFRLFSEVLSNLILMYAPNHSCPATTWYGNNLAST